MDKALYSPANDRPLTYGRMSTAAFVIYLVVLAFAALLLRWIVYYLATGNYRFDDFMPAMCIWDCAFYRDLMLKSYDAVGLKPGGLSDSWAFFPLAPLLQGGVMRATTLRLDVAIWLTSTTFTIAAAIAARPWFERKRAAWLFGAYLLIGPLTPIMAIAYTESLFLLLTILCLNAVRSRRYEKAGIWAGLLSATRSTGILIGLSIFTQFVLDHFQRGGKAIELPLALLRSPNVLLGLALVPVGLLAFMLYLHLHTGDALGFMHAQANWGRVVDWPWRTIISAAQSLWPGPDVRPERVSHAYALFIGFGLCVVLFVIRRFPEAVFCLAVMLVSASAGLGSMTRFVLGLAPFAVLLLDLLSRWRWLYWLSYPAIVALGWLSTAGWLTKAGYLV